VIICLCEGLSESDLREAVRDGAASRYELSMRTGAGRCCGSCRCDLKSIVAEERVEPDTAMAQPPVVQVAAK